MWEEGMGRSKATGGVAFRLDELAKHEVDLRKKMRACAGVFDAHNLRLDGKQARHPELDIYERMANVHEEYFFLHQESQSIEALKRAMFMQWYAANEPGPLTGIGDLNEDVQAAVFRAVSTAVQRGVDDEFLVMLVLMVTICGFYFEHYEPGRVLLDTVKKRGVPDQGFRPSLRITELAGRGQMGDYFSIHARS